MNEDIVRLRKACPEVNCAPGQEICAVVAQRTAPPRRATRMHLAFSVLLIIAVAPAALKAQPDKTGEGELSAYAGAGFGIGAHPAVGGSTGTAFSRYAIGLIDISYMPLSNNTLLATPLAAVYRASGLYDFALSFNIQVPVRKRWAPYGILAGGLLYNVYQAAILTPVGVGFADRSKTNFEFSTGGGVRYYVKDNWGIRPEVRVFISARNFTRISAGIFYNIDSDWPFRLRGNSKAARYGRLAQ